MNEYSVKVVERRREICAWPTDTFEIDHYNLDSPPSSTPIYPHTVLLFVPGNPGCAGWYIPMLKTVVQRLGCGYSARAASYAGHGTVPDIVRSHNEDRDHKIAWSVDGQVEHKVQWIDEVTKDFMRSSSRVDSSPLPRLVWVSHSIGSHLVQRHLILRKDILFRTRAVIHLMPFTRFDPFPRWKKTCLSMAANAPTITTTVLQTSSRFANLLPHNVVDIYLRQIAGLSLVEDRELARGLLCNPEYAKNFITLGMEEVRDVPESFDTSAMRIIGKCCPASMLFCGGPDQWAPKFHLDEMSSAIANGSLPKNITLEYNDDLVHGFIVYPEMIEPVVNYICKSIINSIGVATCTVVPSKL